MPDAFKLCIQSCPKPLPASDFGVAADIVWTAHHTGPPGRIPALSGEGEAYEVISVIKTLLWSLANT